MADSGKQLKMQEKKPFPLLATTSHTPKKKRKRTVAEKQALKKMRDQARDRTRVNISVAFERWRTIRDMENFKSDARFATFLLDSYEKEDLAPLSKPHKKRRKTKHPLPPPPLSSIYAETLSDRDEDFSPAQDTRDTTLTAMETSVETRKKWIVAIRRANFTASPHTRVCSRHLREEDFHKPFSEQGRRLVNRGVVSSLFQWNNFSLPPSRPGVWERRERPTPVEEHDRSGEEAASRYHNHAASLDPAVVDLVLEENKTLRAEINHLKKQVEELHMKQRFGIHRFAASDGDIRFFSRFASYDLLMHFWALIEPSLPSMVSVTQAQRGTTTEPSCPAAHSLQPIDEMFMFLNYLALGYKQRDLADRYGVHQSTVCRIITTWSNFLYIVLGSVRIWIPEEKIRELLPAEFKDYADTTVILDCTELRCQCPSSPLLQSDIFSSNKSHSTLKGLLGVAPHGAVTFISPLYAGSTSDKQILRESGILSLLTPGMAIMVDRGFLVDDFVPCKIYRPAFLNGRSQMPACEVKETQAIARLRVHVERVIRRVKEHKFFDTEIPLWLFGNINQLYTVACLLTNYENGPLIKSWPK